MNHQHRGVKREWKTVTDREARRGNCEESRICSEKSYGKSFKGLTVHPTTRSSPSSNSTSFSLISGLAPQRTEETGSDKKEPESFTRLPAHAHACMHTCAHTHTHAQAHFPGLQGAQMHTDSLSNSFKDHKGGREQGSMDLNSPLLFPIFLLMSAFCFPACLPLPCLSFLFLPGKSGHGQGRSLSPQPLGSVPWPDGRDCVTSFLPPPLRNSGPESCA